jgi:predicted nuclease of predicted toxin-antitoxin system
MRNFRQLADQLSSLGYHAEHVSRVGLRAATDDEIWTYAKQHEMVLICKDEDFASAVWRSETEPQVLWVRLGNTTTAYCGAHSRMCCRKYFGRLRPGSALLR